jgi:hypothetical protein
MLRVRFVAADPEQIIQVLVDPSARTHLIVRRDGSA